MTKWMPIETAPREGTMVLLLVDYEEHQMENNRHPQVTIGMNNLLNDGIDEWMFAGWCWSQDAFTAGRGKPLKWMPIPSSTEDKQ